ncbi:MAG: DUF2332 domain-containing protein [Pseudomonadota bacterium]
MTLDEAFRDQAHSCTRMGSPFTGRLLTALADGWRTDTALAQDFARYTGDIGPAGQSLPLRLAGALHALVLRGAAPELAAVYPPHASDDATFGAAIAAALETHEDAILAFVQTHPQTNEVRRSAALIAIAHVATAQFDRPIALSELGASGGLNLNWDRFALQVGDARLGPADAALTLSPEWSGPVPVGPAPRIATRAGVDLAPLDPSDPDQLTRMMAYLWPDQTERMARTRAAAAIQHTPVAQADAIDWLEHQLATAPAGHMHMIQHTVAWQYFPAEAQARGTALIEAAGARATASTPLAWMSMETDGDRTGQIGAAMTLRLWPGDMVFHLGRIDFHGRWVRWDG